MGIITVIKTFLIRKDLELLAIRIKDLKKEVKELSNYYKINKGMLDKSQETGHCPCDLSKSCPCQEFIKKDECKCGTFQKYKRKIK